MSVVGFDFGTESCIIAVCRKGGLDVLQNETGNRKTATLVAFSGNQRHIGDNALPQASSNWKNTVKGWKNLLRVNRVDHPEFQTEKSYLPYQVVDAGDGRLGIKVKYDFKWEVFSPVQITAGLLQQLKTTAEKGLNTRVVDCVISVPPCWTEEARLAMLDASKIAGLNVLRLMNETSAVALTYGILRRLPPEPVYVLFVDMGYSHTNAAVVKFTPGQLQVLSVETDNQLGGRNFDQVLFNHCVEDIKARYKMDVTTNTKSALKLLKAVQKLKLTLSANTIVPWGVEYIMNDRDVNGKVSRSEFEKACQPLLERVTPLLDSVLAKAGIQKSVLSSVEIIGGGVRVPAVQTKLSGWYGGALSKTCDGDESVARGCALQCAMLSPTVKVRDFNVQDQQPYAVKLEWGNDLQKLEALDGPLFSAGDSVPSMKLVSFTDRSAPFNVVASYYDPSALPAGTNAHIARYTITGFPAQLSDPKPKVKVEFSLNVHGLFTVVKAVLMQKRPEEEAKPEEQAAAAAAPMETGEAKGDKAEDKMDTTTDEQPKAEEGPKKKKKKYDRTALVFQGTNTGLDTKAREAFYEKECHMATQDRVVAETAAARDALERYVLEMSGRIDGGDLNKYITDEERDTLSNMLMEEDDWLMSDEGYDAKKGEYSGKLNGLIKYGNPVVNRKVEADARPGAVNALKQRVGFYQQFAASTDEKYAHITPEQRGKVNGKALEIDNWLSIELTKQDRLPLNKNPSLTKAMLVAKAKELDNVCKPIMNTPKPKPPAPKEEEKKEEKKEETPKENGEAETPKEGATADESMKE